jgi:integrase
VPQKTEKYLHAHKNRHGTWVYYVRIPGRKKVRIRADPKDKEAFKAEYERARMGAGPEPVSTPKAKSGTLNWLWLRYKDSSAWRGLSKATQKQRQNIMSHVLANAGGWEVTSITRREIAATRDRKRDTPAQARNYLDLMRHLFKWAVEAELAKSDPTLGVKNPPKPDGPGFEVWAETEVEQYRKRWKLGTRQRVWMEFLLYTGMRRGDAVKIGPQHVIDGVIYTTTEKSRKKVELTLEILPELQAALDAGPIGVKAFIVGESGKPLTKETFGNFFRAACVAAGVTKSAHGLRKLAATRAAEAGASERELEALFGWRGGAMASLYTRAADRSKLARQAIEKMAGRRAPIGSPVRSGKKTKKSLNKNKELEP